MKKLAVLLVITIAATTCWGQNTKIDTAKAKRIASDLCDCESGSLSKLHPFILEMIEISALESEKKAEDTLKARLEAKPEELDSFLASAALMESEEFHARLDTCAKKVESKYPGLDMEDEQIDEAILNALKQLPKCKIFYMLYLLGTKDDD